MKINWQCIAWFLGGMFVTERRVTWAAGFLVLAIIAFGVSEWKRAAGGGGR